MRVNWMTLGLVCTLGVGEMACAQTAITYQGLLHEGSQPAVGLHDLRFRLYDASVGGAQLGTTLCADDVVLDRGRFTVMLDFGAVYAGSTRYLEIDVRRDTGQGCGNPLGYVTLSGRQALTPAPVSTYAIVAGSATNADQLNGQASSFYLNAANLTGTLGDARLSTNVPRLNAAGAFTAIPSFNGGTSGASAPFLVDSTFKVTNLNADLLDGLDSAAFAPATHTHDAGAIVTGTLADARLSANIGRLGSGQTWSGVNSFTNVGNVFAGNGSGLTSLNAAQLTIGVVSDSRIPSSVPRLGVANTFTESQTISGSGQFPMTITSSSTGGSWQRLANTSLGGREWNLISSGSGNGEGPGRLLIRDASVGAVRMAIDLSGNVGIGTTSPAGKLDLTMADPRLALRNSNDIGGGYAQQSGNTLQLGLYNPSGSSWGVVPGNGFRAAFGMDNTGRVGSMTNTGLAPSFRNILDDGAGNATIQGRVSASNMPAIKYVSTLNSTDQFGQDSRTLIENVTVNVPAAGFLKITCRAPIYIYQLGSLLGDSTAILELKETTGAETLINESKHNLTSTLGFTESVAVELDLTLEHFMAVNAGTRSFKVRLRHAGTGGQCYGDPGSEITIMFFPREM